MTIKPADLDDESWEFLLSIGAEFELFEFPSGRHIEGYTTDDPMNTPFEWYDEEGCVYLLWPTPEASFEDRPFNTVAFWSVSA